MEARQEGRLNERPEPTRKEPAADTRSSNQPGILSTRPQRKSRRNIAPGARIRGHGTSGCRLRIFAIGLVNIARRRLRAIHLSLFAPFALILCPLTFLDFSTPLLERVLILCQA